MHESFRVEVFQWDPSSVLKLAMVRSNESNTDLHDLRNYTLPHILIRKFHENNVVATISFPNYTNYFFFFEMAQITEDECE